MKGPVLDLEFDGTREAFVARFGPTCAAWLVNRFRRTIARYGAFSLHLARGAELPPWCEIALAFLSRRKGWSVQQEMDSYGPKAMRWKIYRLARRRPKPYVFVQGGSG